MREYAVWSVQEGKYQPWFDSWFQSKTLAWNYYVSIRHPDGCSDKERARVMAAARRQGVRVATREEIESESRKKQVET